jgi:hypothetical protein
MRNVIVIFQQNGTTFAIAIACLSLIIARRRREPSVSALRFFAICAVTLLAQTAITAKHPAEQYMLPSVVLLTCAAGVVLAILSTGAVRSIVCFVLVGTVGFGFLESNYRYFDRDLPQWFANDKTDLSAIQAFAAENCLGLFPYGLVSTVEASLLMGNTFSRGRFSADLSRLYPNAVEYSPRGIFVGFISYGINRIVPVSRAGTCIFSVREPSQELLPDLQHVLARGDYRLFRLLR